MGFGGNTTQSMTAVNASETVFGTETNPNDIPAKQASINPLQLSGGQENMNLEHNVSGALGVWNYFGNRLNSFGDPKNLYDNGYSDRSANTQALFNAIYDSIQESSSVQP